MNTPDLFDAPIVRAFERDRRLFGPIDDANARKARAKPGARVTDPETSHAAAAAALPHATEARLLALRLLAERPLTDFELAAKTGMQQTSIGKRRGECAKAGLVRAFTVNGAVFTRQAPSGARATVWEITAAGREFLRANS